MSLKSILGGILFLCIIVVGIYLGGSVLHFIRFPCLLFTMGTTGTLVLMRYRKGDSRYHIYANIKRYVIFCGVIGTFIGIIQMVRNGVTDSSQFMPGLGVALLSTLYSIIIYCIIDTLDVEPGRA